MDKHTAAEAAAADGCTDANQLCVTMPFARLFGTPNLPPLDTRLLFCEQVSEGEVRFAADILYAVMNPELTALKAGGLAVLSELSLEDVNMVSLVAPSGGSFRKTTTNKRSKDGGAAHWVLLFQVRVHWLPSEVAVVQREGSG